MTVTTIEAHVVILLSVAANLVTTLVGLRSLRRKLNGHLAAHTGTQQAHDPHDPPSGG